MPVPLIVSITQVAIIGAGIFILKIEKGEDRMESKTIYKTLEDLPLAMRGDDVAAALNISRIHAYRLMRSAGFPSIRIGKSIRVYKVAFLQWMEDSAAREARGNFVE